MNSTIAKYDAEFAAAVTKHVKNIEKRLETLENPTTVSKAIAATDALLAQGRHVKHEASQLAQLQACRLLSCAHLGRLMVRGKKGSGRGNKNPLKMEGFSEQTIADYRKLGDHFDQIRPYCEQKKQAMADNPESHERITIAGFLAEVGVQYHSKTKAYSGNAEWYTPAAYIEAARMTMGGIDCDPASCAKAQRTVKAKRFYAARDNGLAKQWNGRIWLNPPYTRGLIDQFVAKFRQEFDAARIKQAIILTNSATDASWWHALAQVSEVLCFTQGRINFDGGGDNNTTGQSFFYFGSRGEQFRQHFSQFGSILAIVPKTEPSDSP